MTRKDIATRLDWSQSKVIRIEQGHTPVSPSDVLAMLTIYGVQDQERLEYLMQLAKEARDKESWDKFGVELSAAFRDLISQEVVASTIWKFEPSVVAGVLQTDDYARALLASLGLEPDDVDKRAKLRATRQQVVERGDGFEMHVILGEIALLRPAGPNEVMREQIRHLIDVDKRPNVNIYLLPMSAGTHPGIAEPFTLLQFDEPDLEDVVYLEDAERKSAERDDPVLIDHYLELFNRLLSMIEGGASFKERAEAILHDRYGG